MKKQSLLKNGLIGIFLMLSILFCSDAGYCKPPLKDVYNNQRIASYKKLIMYYNSSINDVVAEKVAKAIIYYSWLHDIEDDRFVAAVITIESMFNPYAISRSGAMGLGQLMPGTAQSLSVSNPFSIEENVCGSCKYLKAQLEKFSTHPRQHRYELTLAAYNAGPGAVDRYGGIPPYEETKAYVTNVINVWREIAGMRPMSSSEFSALRQQASAYQSRRVTNKNSNTVRTMEKKKPVKCEITRKYIKTVIIDDTALENR
jgi:hypothetical protein